MIACYAYFACFQDELRKRKNRFGAGKAGEVKME